MEKKGFTPENKKQLTWAKAQGYFSTVNRTLNGFVAFYMIIYVIDHTDQYAWHYAVTTIGYQLLLLEAIMALYLSAPKPEGVADSSWKPKRNRSTLYLALRVLATVFILTGVILIIVTRSLEHESTHFASAHGLTGLISTVFLLLSVVQEVWTYCSRSNVNSFIKSDFNELFQALLVIFSFVIGMISLMCAYLENKYYFVESTVTRVLFVIIAILTTVLGLIGAVKFEVNSFKKALDFDKPQIEVSA